VSPGKRRGLERIADADGRFRMLATDQRGSLLRLLADSGADDAALSDETLRAVKRIVIRALGPMASGVLTDPDCGFAAAMDAVGRNVGLLLCVDESGTIRLGRERPAQVSARLAHFSPAAAKRVGADAVKILVPYRPDADDGSCAYQQRYVRQIGGECAQLDIPFVLEVVAYPLDEPGKDSPEYARRKPEWVIESARVFSRSEFHADVLKLEFPSDLRYTREYADGAFDGRRRVPVYALEEVEALCREVDAACAAPWVILSAGVGIEEFLVNTRIACSAGASGFLCGRALWQGAVRMFPEMQGIVADLQSRGTADFRRLNEAADDALPWFEHRAIGGRSALSYPDDYLAAPAAGLCDRLSREVATH
jgi:tagatose 1,6-diphosphate aldolase